MKTRFWLNCLLVALFTIITISGSFASSPAEIKKENAPEQSPSVISEVTSEKPRIKTIGIIGGVSWVSSLEYYRLINEMVRDELGGLHSGQILMYSIAFGDFARQERLAESPNAMEYIRIWPECNPPSSSLTISFINR